MKNWFLQVKAWFCNQVARQLNKLRSPLPRGMKEFDTWSNSIITTYGLPNNDSFRFSLATMILHTDAKDADKPKEYYGRCASKAMANQVAAQVIQDLKAKQLAQQQAEATAASAPVASNENKQ